MTLHIRLHARRIALVLGGISLYLALHSIISKAIEWAIGTDSTYWIYHAVQLFNVNRESNIPTWYSSLLLFSCAVLLGVVARARTVQHAPYARHWTGLALIFLLLSVDEAAALHEKLTVPFQEEYGVTGYLYFGWVIVGGIVLALFLLLYARFFFHLPPHTRRLFALAGALYVGGALFVEMISANQWYQNDGTSLTYSAIGTVEELCEMWGVVVLIYALLTYLEQTVSAIHIETSSGEGGTEPEPSA